MPKPVIGPCGGEGQPACPPTPAATINGVDYFTLEQMQEHGHKNYHKGRKDQADSITSVIEDPSHGWSEGEMARAIRAVMSGPQRDDL